MAKGLNEDELKALVMTEMRQAMGYNSSKLSNARMKAEYYYLGIPTGDLAPPEIEGRSSVVSTDVRDTIEAMLPQLMVTFTGGDKVCEFEATGPEDEQKASVATEYVNYLFYKKNNGHKVAYTWMKDALLQKNGIVKCWWDTRNEELKETYRGLTDVELAQVMDDEEVEVISQNTYPDEEDVEQRQKAIEQLTQQLMQAQAASQQGNAQALQAAIQIQAQIDNIGQMPVKMLYDIDCKRSMTDGRITIENVPPEEFLISRNAKDIQTARFVGHRVQRSISELKSMGYKNVDNISGEDQTQATNMERITRLQWNDENAYMSDEIATGDESQRKVWIMEAYVRADFDGDGISELRKVTVAGNELLDNEEVDYIPFVSITPVPLPHTFFGLSVADLSMESQKTKTSILRSQLDNMYLSVNGRYFAVNGQVNLDDLLTSRPGGVVRVNAPGAVGRLDQGAGDLQGSMALMEYLQQDLENKTGWSRQSMGNDASGLQQTATAANIVTNKADMRVDLIARNFAEGFTELFKLILKLVCQYQNKIENVKLSAGWSQIDPREWRNQFDVTINVGIGMGNKDQKVNHLMALMGMQEKVFPLGVANPQNIYHANSELAKLLGYKNTDKFFTDPVKSPQQPKPDPEMMKLQGTMQVEQAKLQQQAQLEQQRAQYEAQADEAKRQHEAAIEQMKAQMQAQVDDNRQKAEATQKSLEMQQQAELKRLEAEYKAMADQRQLEFDQWKAQLDAETKILVAKIGAGAKMDGAPEQPDMGAVLAQALQGFTEAIGHLARPKTVVRGADGRVIGVQ